MQARASVAPAARRFRAWRACSRPLRRADPGQPSISMITANFGGADTFPTMLEDWVQFLGRQPHEVVVVDGGSDPQTVAMYQRLFAEGRIDKLYLMQPGHPENHRYLCFIQEYYAGVLASGDFLFSFRQDTLPFRSGHADWVDEAVSLMKGDPSVFAVSGSSPGQSPLGACDDGWWCLENTSENFALLPRNHHVAAMQVCEGFWSSGWRGVNPYAHIGPTAARCLIECAWDQYCRRQGMRVLMKKEDATWSVFHTNERGETLMRLRQRNQRRQGLEPYYNRVCRAFDRTALQE
jgi:hypothetical protein